MILLNHPCMSHDDFVAYKHRLDEISSSNGFINEHQSCQEFEWTWPALVISTIQLPPGSVKKERWVAHTAITKQRLLKILGLTTEEIKIEFDTTAMERMPDSFEAREV